MVNDDRGTKKRKFIMFSMNYKGRQKATPCKLDSNILMLDSSYSFIILSYKIRLLPLANNPLVLIASTKFSAATQS